MLIVTDNSEQSINTANDVETANETLVSLVSSDSQEVALDTGDLSDDRMEAIAKRNKMEAFEIEMGQHVYDKNTALDDVSDGSNVASILRSPRDEKSYDHAPIATAISDDEPNDMQSLLNRSDDLKQHSTEPTSSITPASNDATSVDKKSMLLRCLPCLDDGTSGGDHMLGNIRILCPRIYASTGGWGVLGPHWFGPPCIVTILASASYYFIYTCGWRNQRYGIVATCTLLTLSTLYNLIQAAYRDPGVIVKGRYVVPDPVPRTFRWCETCQYYQPPRAAHCPDCNVCVAGFDHHCVWMSLCIGKGNFKPFMRFNLSWVAYLIYAIVWVSIVAPILDQK